jgi:phosphotransferase system HPr (HPr) family protein
MALQRQVVVRCEDGLHLRTAMQLVELAQKFRASVRVVRDKKVVDGKSILDLLVLTTNQGGEVSLEIDGEDEEEAMVALSAFLEGTQSPS